jgi:kinesin family protein 2/24
LLDGGAVVGRFSLIDLAGSERGADNDNTDKTTQMEGRQINQSLLALKEVIRAKELGRSHAPFRQSRLTQVLEEALTGAKCRTCVVGCVSPAARDLQQTLNTLRYAEGLRPHFSGKRASTAHPRRDSGLALELELAAAAGGDIGDARPSADAPRPPEESAAPSPGSVRYARTSMELMQAELNADELNTGHFGRDEEWY